MSENPISRRFIRAAWTMVTLQLIVSIAAVAVTGWAALSVATAVNGARNAAQEAAVQSTESATSTDGAPAPAPDGVAPAVEAPPSDATTPPAAPAPGSIEECAIYAGSDCRGCVYGRDPANAEANAARLCLRPG